MQFENDKAKQRIYEFNNKNNNNPQQNKRRITIAKEEQHF